MPPPSCGRRASKLEPDADPLPMTASPTLARMLRHAMLSSQLRPVLAARQKTSPLRKPQLVTQCRMCAKTRMVVPQPPASSNSTRDVQSLGAPAARAAASATPVSSSSSNGSPASGAGSSKNDKRTCAASLLSPHFQPCAPRLAGVLSDALLPNLLRSRSYRTPSA